MQWRRAGGWNGGAAEVSGCPPDPNPIKRISSRISATAGVGQSGPSENSGGQLGQVLDDILASSAFTNTLRHKSLLKISRTSGSHCIWPFLSGWPAGSSHSSVRLSAAGAGTHNCIFAEWSAKRNAQNGEGMGGNLDHILEKVQRPRKGVVGNIIILM